MLDNAGAASRRDIIWTLDFMICVARYLKLGGVGLVVENKMFRSGVLGEAGFEDIIWSRSSNHT